MTTDLTDRLRDLAARTPPAAAPPDLWDRGVRRRRAVIAGRAVVAAAVVVLLGVSGFVWHAARPVEPARTHGSARLPDEFFDPSPWLPAFASPPGPLVALIPARHASLLHTRPALVGVTAASGQYGFLDLPADAVTTSQIDELAPPALSPDGRHIAFWTTGTPSGTPNTQLVGATITGVAVYDTTTGAVVSSPLATVHGLAPPLLVWTGDQTLVLGVSQAKYGDDNEEGCCAGHWQGLFTWSPTEAGTQSSPTPLTGVPSAFLDQSSTTAGAGRLVSAEDSHSVAVFDLTPPGSTRKVRLPVQVHQAALSPDGRRLAATSNRHPRQLRVVPVGRLGDGQRDRPITITVGGRHTGSMRVIGWRSATHVVTTRSAVAADGLHVSLVTVDVRTGQVRELVRGTGSDQHLVDGLQIASGLLAAPSAHADAPPSPWSRRAEAISLGSLVLLVGVMLLVRRFRGRRT